MKIIGREKEITKLKKIFKSNKAELVIVKGRRRVGKTYLIDNLFNSKFIFSHTGLSPFELNSGDENMVKQQLNYFTLSLKKYGLAPEERITNWPEAFFALEQLIDQKNNGERVVVFIDELPWLDTPKSQFISAFSYFWNNYASKKSNLMVIVSGSSNSWLDDVFFNSYGGFYRRATREIKLAPFSLRETKDLLINNGFVLSDYEIVKVYMMFGGIPFYLNLLDSDYSIAQNVDDLFFSNSSILKNEFDLLFNSILKNSDNAKKIIRLLSSKRIGYTQSEISKKTSISDGGGLSKTLESLCSSDIIRMYNPINEKKNVRLYKLIDPFCLFYLKFIDNNLSLDSSFWQDNQFSQNVNIFNGFAFENLVFYHIDKIKLSLGISGVTTDVFGFKEDGKENLKGGQIDLVILRKDNIVNCCEIKFYNDVFTLNNDYLDNLKNKERLLNDIIKKRQVVEHVFISPFGIKKNEYSSFFKKIITLKDLF